MSFGFIGKSIVFFAVEERIRGFNHVVSYHFKHNHNPANNENGVV